MNARGWLPFAAIAVLVAGVVALLAPRGGGDGPPLDPRSTKGLGTRALVETLGALGGDVAVTRDAPDASFTTALVLADDLPPARRDQVERWVRGGGTLVVTDPSSPLVPFPGAGSTDVGLFQSDIDRRCDLPALRGVGRVSVEGGTVFDAPAGTDACYPRGDGHWLVAAPVGEGTLVALGGAAPFVNRHLDEAGNAAVIAALLVPRQGTRVAFLRRPPPGTAGRRSLADLVSPRVKAAGWQLGFAFVLLALWRGRRLGRPVPEAQPVPLAGSELVVAVGGLLQRTGNRGRAAEVLRDDLRRECERRGVDRALIAADLDGPPPRTDAELVELAHHLDSVRREVTRVRAP